MSQQTEQEKANAAESQGVVVPRRRRGEGDEEGETQRRGILLVLPLVMVGAAVAYFVLEGMKDNAVYSKGVDDLVREQAKFAGRQVRAEGTLVHGSLVRRDQPCEYRFSIEKNGVTVPVRYPSCSVPDTFVDRADMPVGVTVEGELGKDGAFVATNVLAKCPSKYEMKDRANKGEKMPHAAMEPLGEPAPAAVR